jgi:hypothetical protein
MSGDPFSNSQNFLQHVFVPAIVSTDTGYQMELNIENISNIGSDTLRVSNLWVDTLHFVNTDPPIFEGGGTATSGSTATTCSTGAR